MIWKRNALHLSQLKSGFVADRQGDGREVTAGGKGRCGEHPPPPQTTSLPLLSADSLSNVSVQLQNKFLPFPALSPADNSLLRHAQRGKAV